MQALAAAMAAALILCSSPSRARAQTRNDINEGSAWRWVQDQAVPGPIFQLPAGRPLSTPTKPADNPWERVIRETKPPAESIGFFSRGCIRGAVELAKSGSGYEKMRVSRNRAYGHPRLIEFLKNLAKNTSATPNLGTLLIGDMGYPRGGPFRSGHKSHQTGLDVDIWYRQVPNGTRVSDTNREEWESPELIDYDSTGFYIGLNGRWSPNELEILRLTALDASVQRIFVSPVIKKLACTTRTGEAWISKLRAEWGHGDHFHVRLNCEGPLCEAQNPVPDDGCGKGLDEEWFSPAARETWRKNQSRHIPWGMPALPAECASVLREP
jgi:penicillin-insensitive murein endopeptidase